MDWQGIRHGIESPNFEGCATDGDCLSSTTGEFGCCSGMKHTSGVCPSQAKCGCIKDGQCMGLRNDATECCSGSKHFTTLCPSQKKCGCLEDGACLNVDADETDCCSGEKSLTSPLKCPSLKQCGGNSTALV